MKGRVAYAFEIDADGRAVPTSIHAAPGTLECVGASKVTFETDLETEL